MGCGGSKPLVEEEPYKIPRFKRTAMSAADQAQMSEDNSLPLGILLTGGGLLRQAGYDGKGVRVAVIDSGIDEKHPGFDGKVQRKVWYRAGTPLSQDDHGTHVAGTIHLMAPAAAILDYRVFGKTGKCSVTDAVAQAIVAATDVGCQLINMSLGGPVSNSPIKRAIEYATSKGVILVCAAGNEGDNNPLTNEIRYDAFLCRVLFLRAGSVGSVSFLTVLAFLSLSFVLVVIPPITRNALVSVPSPNVTAFPWPSFRTATPRSIMRGSASR
jgi:major intracellular serine protease